MRQGVKQLNSHTYELTEYTVGTNGLEKTGKVGIWLLRGSKNSEEQPHPQDGILTEQLLTVCEEYLTAVNVGKLATRETAIAITKIQEALMWLNKRHEDRKARGVATTYQK